MSPDFDNREEVAAREIERLRLGGVGTRDEKLQRIAAPARAVDDRFGVGRKTRACG